MSKKGKQVSLYERGMIWTIGSKKRSPITRRQLTAEQLQELKKTKKFPKDE